MSIGARLRSRVHSAGDRPTVSLAIWRGRHGALVALGASGVEIMRVPLLLSAFFVLTTISASGGEQLRIAVSPAVSFAPSRVDIRARVVPNAENRALEVIAESEDFYRSSLMPLEGESAPGTIMFAFGGLPGGDYVISGILTDSGGRQRAIARQQLTVISSERQ